MGFRYFAALRARSLGLAGWVRNLRDGSVELEAEGERASLEALVAELRAGPPGAGVRELDDAWSQGAPRQASFEVRG